MSLLTSIFGSNTETTTQTTPFDSKVEVPEPKKLPPADRKRKSSGSESKKAASNKPKVQDDPEKEERTIFVGNLPVSVTRKQIDKIFSDCGKIESSRIRSVATQGVKVAPEHAGDQDLVRKVCVNTKRIDTEAKSTVSAYVVFESAESVEKALDMNNQTVTIGEEKHRIRVDHASPTIDASRSIFVGNLPYGAEEESLQQHFAKGCGMDVSDIEGVRIIRDKETFKCKGFAYILFKDRSMLSKALRTMEGSQYMKREIRVRVCGKRFKGNKDAEKKGKKRDRDDQSTGESKNTDKPKPFGALRRLLAKEEPDTKKRRVRGEKKKGPPGKSSGKSKRAASEAKTEKRVKKLEKRVTKGMGKTRNR